MPPNLLQEILLLGDQMLAAIKEDNLDLFLERANERSTLVEQLAAYETPAQVASDWEKLVPAYTEQHRLLTDVLRTYESKLGQARLGHNRFRDAWRSYHAHPNRRRILNKHLRG
jgi:hypothetical protein